MKISDLSGCNLVGLSSSIAIFLSENMSALDLGILAAFLTGLGDNLTILATTKALQEEVEEK